MTIKELVEYQQQSGHICLIKQGLFFRAYNQGAVLLNRLFGYQIKCKFSKSCDTMLYYVGFPSAIAEKVTLGVVGQGGRVVRYDKNYIEYSGIDVCYDAELLKTTAVMSPREKRQESVYANRHPIVEKVRLFNTSNATPLEALQFIAQLQNQLNAESVYTQTELICSTLRKKEVND